MSEQGAARAALLSTSILTAASLLAVPPALAGALPSGGHYVAGQGSFAKARGALTVDQSSAAGIIDWSSFAVGKSNTVTIDNGHGATLNRVSGGDVAVIAGDLKASGTLYLIDPEGVVVGGTGKVVAGGSFVAATTLPGTSKDALAKSSGRIIDAGSVVARNATLDGNDVRVSGAVSVERGGHIWLTGAHATAIAGTLDVKGGEGAIETSGAELRIAGTVDAGRGGSWTVDPHNLTVTASAAKTIDKSLDKGTNVTLATTASGTSGPGTPSSGPGDIIVAASIAWTTGASLTLDAYHSVTVKNGVSITNTGAGDLTLAADTAALDSGTVAFLGSGDVAFAGGTGNVTIFYHPKSYADPTTYDSNVSVHSGSAFVAYMTVDNASDLQAINKNLAGVYALNADIDASAIANFAPIGSDSDGSSDTQFEGTLFGRGHIISGLTIRRDATYVGLFGFLGASADVYDFTLADVSVTGTHSGLGVGGLAGKNEGTVDNVAVAGAVSGKGDYIGGLIGDNGGTGTIDSSSSSATVTDDDTAKIFVDVGGLAGINYDLIEGSNATGAVTEEAGADSNIGGLVGWNDGGEVTTSYAEGDVTANKAGSFDDVGGLVGQSGYLGSSTVSSSSATGTVTAPGFEADVGGLVGAVTANSTVTGSQASGDVTGLGKYAFVGGLVGNVVYDTGSVSGNASGDVRGGADSYDGGLVGAAASGSTVSGSATGSVRGGKGSCTGQIIGYPNHNKRQPGCE